MIQALLGPLLRMVAKEAAKDLAESAAKQLVRQVQGHAAKMQLEVSVQLDLSNLRKLKGESRKAVYRAVQRAAKPVREAVQANAGRIKRFGFLEKSIGSKTKMKRGGIFTVIGPKMSFRRKKQRKKVGTIRGDQGRDNRGKFTSVTSFDVRHKGVEAVPFRYAWILEFGSKRSKKKEFLRPAWATAGPGYKSRVIAEIAAELAKVNALGANG